jgi:hypothetical protein
MEFLSSVGVMSTLTQFRVADGKPSVWSKIVPLWRVLIWALAVFFLLVTTAVIRLDVQRLQMDFDRNDRMRNHALITQERLLLELDVRKRLGAIQGYASAAELVHVPTTVVREGHQ